MFYHNSDLYYNNNPEEEGKFGWGQEGSPHPFRRSICFAKLYYNEDGTNQKGIKNISQVNVKQMKNLLNSALEKYLKL